MFRTVALGLIRIAEVLELIRLFRGDVQLVAVPARLLFRHAFGLVHLSLDGSSPSRLHLGDVPLGLFVVECHLLLRLFVAVRFGRVPPCLQGFLKLSVRFSLIILATLEGGSQRRVLGNRRGLIGSSLGERHCFSRALRLGTRLIRAFLFAASGTLSRLGNRHAFGGAHVLDLLHDLQLMAEGHSDLLEMVVLQLQNGFQILDSILIKFIAILLQLYRRQESLHLIVVLRLRCLRSTVLLKISAQILDYVARLRILCKLLSRWWQFTYEILRS